jgi:hypothetical protein
MTKFLATLLATSMLVMAAAPAMAMTIAEKCGPDGPEVYKRAGGFCEVIGNNDSIASESKEKPQYVVVSVVLSDSL